MPLLRSFFHVTAESAFEVISLPLAARVYLAGFRPYRSRWERTTARLPWRALFRVLAAADLCGPGRAAIQVQDEQREFSFRTANTQFHSLYLPQFAGGYELETQTLIQILTGVQGTFFDVGANWGHLSIGLAAMDGYRGGIHAFEPAKASFEDLRRTTRCVCPELVTCHQVALAEINSDANLELPDHLHSGLARITRATGGERVRVAALDALGLPPPTTIKLDVEGAEHRVLLGAMGALETARPYVLLESWRDADAAAPLKLLEALQYDLYEPLLISDCGDLFHYGQPLPQSERLTLGLNPFAAANRHNCSEHFNALACPRERRSDLELKLASNSVREAMEL